MCDTCGKYYHSLKNRLRREQEKKKMKRNKNKEGCNGGWITKPRIKLPPNKTIPDQKKKQSKGKCREKVIQREEE